MDILNSSSTGGVLTPAMPFPLDDFALDELVQGVVSDITTLDSNAALYAQYGSLVRPRWQPTPPIQPAKTVNWCAFGLMSTQPDDGPAIGYDPVNDVGTYQRHEITDWLFSFYGPNSVQYAKLLRDGLAIPQNCETFTANDMAYIDCGGIRQVPELVNQEWVRRQDMTVTLRREINRTYPIRYLAFAQIVLLGDVTTDVRTYHPATVNPTVVASVTTAEVVTIDRVFNVPDIGQVLLSDAGDVFVSDGANPSIVATEP